MRGFGGIGGALRVAAWLGMAAGSASADLRESRCVRLFTDVPRATVRFARAELHVRADGPVAAWWGNPPRRSRVTMIASDSPPAARLPFNGGPVPAEWRYRAENSLVRRVYELSLRRPNRFAALRLSPTGPVGAAERASARARYEEILRLLEAVRVTGTLLDAERRQLELELVERGARRLVMEGVRVRIECRPHEVRLVIVRDGTHPMNQHARTLPAGVALSYAPMLSGGPLLFGGFYETTSLVGIGAQDLLLLDPTGLSLLHERRHAFNASTPGRRLGISSGDGATLPSVDTDAYRRHQSHDEVDTYLQQLRLAVGRAVNALTAVPYDAAAADAAIRQLPGPIKFGLETTRRNLLIARQTAEAVAGPEPPRNFRPARGYTVGRVRIESGEDRYWSTFPLEGSSGVDDPTNLSRLREAIGWLGDVSGNFLGAFLVAQQAYQLVIETPSRTERIALLEALYGTIRPWSRDNYRPVTVAETIERFNTLLDFHWERITSP